VSDSARTLQAVVHSPSSAVARNSDQHRRPGEAGAKTEEDEALGAKDRLWELFLSTGMTLFFFMLNR
jgi:hypothetical protein